MASTNSIGDPIQFDQVRDYTHNFILNQYSGNGITISREQIEDARLRDEAMRRLIHPNLEEGRDYDIFTTTFDLPIEYTDITFGEINKDEKDSRKKGNLKMSVECFLELLGITTDVQMASIRLDVNNDTINISLRSKDEIIPVGDDMMIKMMEVPEGMEIPNVAVEPLDGDDR